MIDTIHGARGCREKQDDHTRLPPDTYHIVLTIAKSYYTLLRRRREIDDAIRWESRQVDGPPGGAPGNPTARKAERLITKKDQNERKIQAIEKAWNEMSDDTERELIERNLFQKIPMNWINLPMSERSMKRVRRRFLRCLAEELGEL